MSKTIKLLTIITLFVSLNSCKKDATIEVLFDDTPYILQTNQFPTPDLPADNALTIQGVKLGKMLFYEESLSRDQTQSCASCHRQTDGFSDSTRFSIGVEGLPGGRQAMPIFNMAWHTNEFFWDGRAHLLRDQALLPIQDPLEMNETLENIVNKLNSKEIYRNQFIRAFGSDEINNLKISLALEQFMLSIVSHNSKYDQYVAGEITLTPSELRGLQLFETEYNPFFPESSGADCIHCHGGINFENDNYMNNGLDSDFNQSDIGRQKTTNDPQDKAKFKVPSLRNIAVTSPYMHDGRFKTLEEVVQHYNNEIQLSPTLDPAILPTVEKGLLLDESDITDLINFLETLTDQEFLNNPEYQNPF